MADDPEIVWHKEQIAKKPRCSLEELESGNTTGGDVFPETQAEIDRLNSDRTVRADRRCLPQDNPELP